MPTLGKKLASFDVVDFLKRKLSSLSGYPYFFIDLIRLCVANNGEFYKQINGIDKESSLSPVLKNLYVLFDSELLPSVLPSDTPWFRCRCYLLYVANEPFRFRFFF